MCRSKKDVTRASVRLSTASQFFTQTYNKYISKAPHYLPFVREIHRWSVFILSWRSRSHYDDAIMGAIASEITSLTIVYSTVYSDADQKKTSKLRVTGLCAGNSPGAGEFPAQMASSAENVSIWWRHHELLRYAPGNIYSNIVIRFWLAAAIVKHPLMDPCCTMRHHFEWMGWWKFFMIK